MFEEQHVHHGHLVHHHNITFQRILFVVLEAHVARHVVFHGEHAVDGTGVVAGEVGDAAGSSARWCGDHDPISHLLV